MQLTFERDLFSCFHFSFILLLLLIQCLIVSTYRFFVELTQPSITLSFMYFCHKVINFSYFEFIILYLNSHYDVSAYNTFPFIIFIIVMLIVRYDIVSYFSFSNYEIYLPWFFIRAHYTIPFLIIAFLFLQFVYIHSRRSITVFTL